jgi:hypothetical protein
MLVSAIHHALHAILPCLPVLGACLALALSGCEREPTGSSPPATEPAGIIAKPMLWKGLGDEAIVAVNDPAVERALADAGAAARKSLDDARQRWAIAKPAERGLWAVKWAAPLAPPLSQSAPASEPAAAGAASVEHIWVQPINWSPFRIEGVLLSTPRGALECGRSAGEIVSFPIDELSDWIHFASEAPDAPFEGGYSVKVLEEAYGKPR